MQNPPPTAAPFDYDAALMACARGDRQALQQLYQREGRYLMGVALRIVRQRQQAEDVLHDAFISIWQRAETFNPARGEGRGWVYSVVRNAALNMVRSGARQVDVSEDAAEAIDDQAALAAYAAAGDQFELRADLGRLENCLNGLEPARRDCILFAYVEGCSHGEIAERLQTPLGTVKAWILRGMRALRECMA
ncbi:MULTISPECIES: sigma-70 family RNA polymerase sigma factor [unclassified Variovorax]|uniref:sigma-70 family RNA polymerase sigma factor n=1 Tax=unclassified Variovorax TaxID=663243 RepID=UPI000F7E3AEA|nr:MULTISPECIES: sigma-70 family RNA polymerase sigma factor [unclassified Variovorax]RSZ43988.1 sigma-70 family RNA polymerase sigma factor [Variovorax sp. 553]RSZ45357.1 sigma-70 family RNA polymerase sigma factor [Variovorax sp. 679]